MVYPGVLVEVVELLLVTQEVEVMQPRQVKEILEVLHQQLAMELVVAEVVQVQQVVLDRGVMVPLLQSQVLLSHEQVVVVEESVAVHHVDREALAVVVKGEDTHFHQATME
jgi:hypothetical protein